MIDFDPDDYTDLTEEDLNPKIVKRKLEKLVSNFPENLRPQIDRCLSMSFSDVLDRVSYSEEGRKIGVPYFTEDPQSLDFHMKAFHIFCPVVAYGGSIGELIRISHAKSNIKPRVLSSAAKVFKYAETVRPLPSYDREDLIRFMRSVKNPVRMDERPYFN